MTQKELAKMLNSTDKSIWGYENGIATPPADVLIAYADFFNVSTDYLLGRTDELGGVVMPQNSPAASELTAKEREILQLYNGLNPSGKELVEQTLKTLSLAGSSESRKNA